MLYFQWRSSSGNPAWLVLCLVLSLVLPEAEFTECSSSTLATGLPATDCELTSALQVSVEVVRGPAQHQRHQPEKQQQRQQQQQQQQQQRQQRQQQPVPHQGPTTPALRAVIKGAAAATPQHRGGVSASWSPLPTPAPTLQAQAVPPCLRDDDLRKNGRPCEYPQGGAVAPAESAIRQRTSPVPHSQERSIGPTALPLPLAFNTSSMSSASWLISSSSLQRAEEMLASTVQSSSGSASLLILACILIGIGVSIVLFAGQTRDQRPRRQASPGNRSTSMGSSISLLPSTRHLGAGPLPSQSAKLSMTGTGRQSIGRARPFPPDTTSSMPPAFRSQASDNWKLPGSSSMPPLHSQPGQTSLSPWQLTQTALSSRGLQQRVQLCEPGAAWSHIDLYFTISTEVLQSIADSDESTGAFDVWRGGGDQPEPLFAASVLPWGSSPRALVMYAVGNRGELLASCAPSVVNSGSELEIRDQDSRVWGTLSPQGSDTYAVFQGRGRRVLSMLGNQDTGQLMVKLGEEVVAHAAHNGTKKQVEIGVRPQVDPVLMLVCVLAVLIFNPEEP